jgi:hypothetical protein
VNSEDVKQNVELKNNNKDSSIKFNLKLQKIKLAKKLAITSSRKKNVAKNANELESDVDDRIRSVALSKFIFRKAQRLKKLGQIKSEINSVILDLTTSEDSVLTRSNSALQGFGLDKKFIGLSIEQILAKIEPSYKKKPKKPVEPVEPAQTPETPKTSEKPETSEPKKQAVPDKLKISSNKDVDTTEDVEQTNDKIYEYLVQKGELGIADYILDLMTKPEAKEKNVSEVKANTAEIKHLSVINSDIREKLSDMEENMVDEQDTSVSIPKKLEQEQQNTQLMEQEKEGKGFLQSVLKMLFGNNILKLLMSSGSVLGIATTILGTGWKFLKGKISTLFSTMIKLALKPFKLILDGFKFVMNQMKTAISKIPSIKKLLPDFKTNKEKKANKDAKKLSRATKSAKKMPEYSKKLSESRIKGNKTPTGLLKKLTKFTKFIPFIGTAIAAGTAIYSAQDGYNNAGEILGKDKDTLTTTDKLAAAAGSLVNDVSFGLISSRETAEKILKLTQPEKSKPEEVLKEDAQNSKNSKINMLETGIAALKTEQLKAEKVNDTVKQENISRSIDQLQEKIKSLSIVAQANKTTKEDINKNKQIQLVEDTSRKLVDTTKNGFGDASKVIQQGIQQGFNSINTINGSNTNHKPHELFQK